MARDYSPSSFMGIMWNHRQSWQKQRNAAGERAQFDTGQTADLVAYAFSKRYFEKPGDAARGKEVFLSKRCAECHGLDQAKSGSAKPVTDWASLTDPIALAAEMWDHAPRMMKELASRKVQWAQLTTEELTDLLVYLQNLPETRNRVMRFSPGPAQAGKRLFASKGCVECHAAGMPLESKRTPLTMTDFAACMWNHGLKAGTKPPLSHEEMGEVFGYLWSLQLFVGRGDSRRGERVFSSKGCAACHIDPSTRVAGSKDMSLHYGESDLMSMATALWNHEPGMVAAVGRRKGAWPRLSGTEMADLLAYLSMRHYPAGDSGRAGLRNTQ